MPIAPLVHINGTDRDTLIAGYKAARNAIMDANFLLRAAGPNGRDYYTLGPEAWNTAVFEHAMRLQQIEDIARDLSDIIAQIQNQE